MLNLLLPVALALQVTINVPGDYATIQEAVDNAAPGDTIEIQKADGPYEPFVITETDQLTINGNDAKVDAAVVGDDGPVISTVGQVDDLHINELTLLSGSDQLVLTGNGLMIDDCLFRNANENALDVDGNGATVTDSIFTGAHDTAIVITGDEAFLEDNEVTFSNGTAIDIAGESADVIDNDLTWVDGDAIVINGGGATVTDNRVERAAGDGLHIENGSAMFIEHNRVEIVNDDGLDLQGDGTVLKNLVFDPSGIGIVMRDATVASTIEDNKVLRALNGGIRIADFVGTVEDNFLRDGGDGGNNAFAIAVLTDGATILDNKSSDWGGIGIYVEGSNNVIQDNTVLKALTDGVHVELGDNNQLINNKVVGSGGEGLDNGGTNTLVDSNTWKKSHSVDRANEATEGATLVLMAPDTDEFETEGEPTVD